MTNGQFGTDAEAMARACTQVQQVSDTINTHLASLRAEVGAASGHWQGQASAAFQRLMDRWDVDSKQLNEALRQIADQLGQTSRGYTSADEDASGALTSVGLNLS